MLSQLTLSVILEKYAFLGFVFVFLPTRAGDIYNEEAIMSAMALLVVALLQVAPVAPSIIDQAQRRDARGIQAQLDRPFASFFVGGCQSDLPQAKQLSILAVLGPEVRSLTVVEMVSNRWLTFDGVRDYIKWVLAAPAEGGKPMGVPWSEGTTTQLSIIVDWSDGRRGRMQLGHGPAGEYAHFESRLGCEWFTRLGRMEAK